MKRERDGTTGGEIVMQAARSFTKPFTVHQLVVAAWHLAPATFGLKVPEELPDSKKIESLIYGGRGLLARGLLVRVRQGLFKAIAAEAEPVEPAPPPPEMPPQLKHAQASAAYVNFNSGGKDTISFRDALAFWGLPRNPKPDEIEGAIDLVAHLLADRDTPELRVLGACHDYLRERFSRHLAMVRGREVGEARGGKTRAGSLGKAKLKVPAMAGKASA